MWRKLLSAACVALLYVGQGRSYVSQARSPGLVGEHVLTGLERRDDRHAATTLYRGDWRSPDAIRRAGGFEPRGRYWEQDRGFSINHHVAGENGAVDDSNYSDESDEEWETAFVSVTTSLNEGASYGRWLYMIHATPNILDPNRANDMHPECFALAGVRWNQIMGWVYVPVDANGNPIDDSPITEASFTRNPEYDAVRYDGLALTLVDPHSSYGNRDRRYYENFMSQPNVGSSVGYTGRFPLAFEGISTRHNDVPDEPPPQLGPSRQDQNQDEAEEFDLNDILAVAEYVHDHREPCHAGSQGEASGSGSGRDWRQLQDRLAADMTGMNDENIVALTDANIQRDVELLRNGGQDGVCHLLPECLSGSWKSKRAVENQVESPPASSPSKKSRMENVCRKISKLDLRRRVWSWSHELQEQNCSHIENLGFYFKMGDRSSLDTISVDFVGPDGSASAPALIARGPKAGFHTLQHINLDKTFNLRGAKTVPLARLSKLRLLTDSSEQNKWSMFDDDYLKVQGLRLRAHCAGSGLVIGMNKWASLNRDIHVPQKSRQVVWEDTMDIREWNAQPLCSHMKMLQITIHLSFSVMAAPNYGLELQVGQYRVPLPRGGSGYAKVITMDVDMNKAFGSSTFATKDLKMVALATESTQMGVTLDKMYIHAVCDGPQGFPVEIAKDVDTWIVGGHRLPVRVRPDEWVKRQ